jgi:hypothetical protein
MPLWVEGGHSDKRRSSEVIGVDSDFGETTRAIEEQPDPAVAERSAASGVVRGHLFTAIDLGFRQEAPNSFDNFVQRTSFSNPERSDGSVADIGNLDRFDDQCTFTIAKVVLHMVGIHVSAFTPAIDASSVIYEGQAWRWLSGTEWNVRETLLRSLQ